MLQSFFPVGINSRRETPLAPIPEFYGGDERYLYIPNWYDQTVSVIDTDTDTVITTISLTAAKNFASVFYRAINKSVYLFGDSYFNRIDADPDSGTFHTLVEAGASSVNLSGTGLCYLPWPLDIICNSGASVRWHKFINHNDATAAGNDYVIFERNSGISIGGNSNYGPITFGHAIGIARLAPKNGIMFFRSEQSYKYKVLCSSKDINTNGHFTFVQEPWQMDLDRVGVVGNGYIFDNMVLPGSSGSIYSQRRGIHASPLGRVLVNGSGGVTPFMAEYCPVNGKGAPSGYYCFAGESVLTSVFTVGFNTYTDNGDLDRTAYKAAGETKTSQIIYNHRNNKLYVRGQAFSQFPTVCNLIHVYDMSQPVASMYLTSITVGNLVSTQKLGNNAVNNMCFNQTKYYEAWGVTL